MVGAEVEFLFSAEWEPLIKTAVFIAGSEKRVVLETEWRDNICTIPHECLAEPDVHLSVGVYGTNTAGSLVIPTVYADLGMIWTGADPDGESGAAASPELWAQLLAQLDLKEASENKVTSLSSASTHEQYPSARAVYEALGSGGIVVIDGTVNGDMSEVTITTPDAWTLISEAWNNEKRPLVVLRLSDMLYAYLTGVSSADLDGQTFGFAIFSIPSFYTLDGSPPRTVMVDDANQAAILVTTDSVMSDTSVNAVQNKVVKKYIDDNTQPKGDYALRSELFSGSYNDLKDKPESPAVPTDEINANTAARHSHDNKTVLDGITAEKIAAWDSLSNAGGTAELTEPYGYVQSQGGAVEMTCSGTPLYIKIVSQDDPTKWIEYDANISTTGYKRWDGEKEFSVEGGYVRAGGVKFWINWSDGMCNYILMTDKTQNTVMLRGTWLESNNSIDFDDIPAGSTAYDIIYAALESGKSPILCITNVAGDWDAYFHLSLYDWNSAEYQFASFETQTGGSVVLKTVWVTSAAAGYKSTTL